ncbi:MAG: DUF2298 domain-containing protein [Patescibacteria group bacterium]
MGADFFLVVKWWTTLFLVGVAAFPLTRRLFRGWWDQGYLFSKAVGMAVVAWLVYALGTVKLLPFTVPTVALVTIFLFAIGVVLQVTGDKRHVTSKNISLLILEELLFFAALLFWSWIKGHEASIRSLEKFMDFGFMKSILDGQFFPPTDMWYAGSPINYYYFGHLVTAVLTKLSGIDLAYTFNLMLATLFSLTFTMAFSIGVQLFHLSAYLQLKNYESGIMNYGKNKRRTIIHNSLFMLLGGALTAFLVTLAGNLQTLYVFTRGYTGEDPPPFWQLFWRVGEFWQRLPEGLNRYWYANATRFIPFTIHEFPSYSFVVSDVHGHVLSIPFALLAIGLIIQLAISDNRFSLVFFGFLVGVLLMTNALDGPIYLGLFLALLLVVNGSDLTNWANWKEIGKIMGVVVATAVVASLPFLSHFKSFVNGLAINCPPEFFADTKIGPFIFETVDKCQRSPIWMWLLLWGFFLYCGSWLFFGKKWQTERSDNPIERVLKVFFLFSLALIIFPEFFYFKDIYPAHFRSNTMFKLGYQAFILFSIVAGYTIVKTLVTRDTRDVIRKNLSLITYHLSRRFFLLFLLPQLFLVSIYPIFSVRSYFGALRNYEGLYGLNWLEREYPGDWAAIRWFNSQNAKCQKLNAKCERFALVEAEGDSYTDYARFSALTGMPTIIGWPVHEWLWRGTYDVVAPRREEVRMIYESQDLEETQQIFRRYNVHYVVVGTLERQKYQNLAEGKFSWLGEMVFSQGNTQIYRIR